MKVTAACVIAAPAQRVWEETKKTKLLRHVCAPMMHFKAIDPQVFPERWQDGQFKVALHAFGILPVGTQWIVITTLPADGDAFRLRDNGHGDLAKRWDHLITVAPRPDGQTNYRDDIDVDAGLLTPLIAAYAWVYYRHRQRRWRRLARNDFVYGNQR